MFLKIYFITFTLYRLPEQHRPQHDCNRPTLPALACTGLVSGDGDPGRLVAPLKGASGSANSRS